MSRSADLAFEKLVEVTRANPDFERGQLNKALASIRSCCERDGIPADDVAREIGLRAGYYHETFPGLTLTPTALARHWYRVLPQGEGTDQALDRWKEKYG
jgi:hypothetical protein